MNKRADIVRGSGLTFLGSNWPVDVTLLSSGSQSLPGWQANATANGADQVLVLNNGAWSTYWWNGTNWRRNALGSPISDTVLIRAGTGILVNKLVPGANSLLTQIRPF